MSTRSTVVSSSLRGISVLACLLMALLGEDGVEVFCIIIAASFIVW